MDNLKTKEDVQEYARLLKNFYGELYTYIIVNCGLVLIWLFSGAGYFWPIWPIGVWGISLLIKASKLRVIDSSFYDHCHSVRERVVFLKKDWEEEKVSDLLKQAKAKGILKDEGEVNQIKRDLNHPTDSEKAASKKAAASTPVVKKTSPKKTAVKKPAAKKVVIKKSAVKKVATKKAAAKKPTPKK